MITILMAHIPSSDSYKLFTEKHPGSRKDFKVKGTIGSKISCAPQYSFVHEIENIDIVVNAHDHDNDFFGMYSYDLDVDKTKYKHWDTYNEMGEVQRAKDKKGRDIQSKAARIKSKHVNDMIHGKFKTAILMYNRALGY